MKIGMIRLTLLYHRCFIHMILKYRYRTLEVLSCLHVLSCILSGICRELNIKKKETIYYGITTSHSVCVLSLSCVQLFATPQTRAHQAPLSMEFSRQEYWSMLLLFPTPGDPLNPGINPRLLCLLHWQILYHCATWEAHNTQQNWKKTCLKACQSQALVTVGMTK